MGANHEAIAFKLRLKIHFRDCFCCRYCGKHMNPLDDDIEIDHVDPKGDNSETNLVTCCKRCNIKKRDKHAVQFMAHRALKIAEEIAGVKLRMDQWPSAFPPMLERKPKPMLTELLEEVAREFQVPSTRLVMKDNRREFVDARRSFCVQARNLGFSLPQIALVLHKHHTTVMHLISTAAPVENKALKPIDSQEVKPCA